MNALLHSQIQKITQPFPHCVILEVYGKKSRQHWLFSAHARFPRICQSWQSFKSPALPPIFCLWLRTRILQAKITQIAHLSEHVCQFSFKREEEVHFLIWEENGNRSNLLLLDHQQGLLFALYNPNQGGRTLKQKMRYTPPTQWDSPPFLPNLPKDLKEQDAYLWQLEQTENTTQGRCHYQKHFKTLKKRLARRLKKQEQDLENCQKAGQWRQWGELLKPHLHEIQTGQQAITVLNYFDEKLSSLTIPLHPQYSPTGNLTRLFQKAEKLRKALPHVEKRIWQTLAEQEKLRSHQEQLHTLDTMEGFHTWEATLPKFLKIPKPPPQIKTKNQSPTTAPFTRLSSDGWMIVVGRNKHQNAYVTFTIARGNDWWFHAQGIAGSHVIVKCPQAVLPAQTILEAAQLAAYYCKARGRGKVDVDYTQRKYVRKIKGGEPGRVTYSQNKTIFVELDESQVQRVLEREADEKNTL